MTAKDDAGVDVTSTLIKSGSVSFTGYTVRFQVKAGTNGKAYVIRTFATLNNANTDKEVKEGIVRVMDLEV